MISTTPPPLKRLVTALLPSALAFVATASGMTTVLSVMTFVQAVSA